MNVSDLKDRLDRLIQQGRLTEGDAKLVSDFAAGGASCLEVATTALSKAGWARDVQGVRKALGGILSRAGRGKLYF